LAELSKLPPPQPMAPPARKKQPFGEVSSSVRGELFSAIYAGSARELAMPPRANTVAPLRKPLFLTPLVATPSIPENAASRMSLSSGEIGPFCTHCDWERHTYSPLNNYGDMRPGSAAGKRIVRNGDWDSPSWKGGPRKTYSSPGSPAWTGALESQLSLIKSGSFHLSPQRDPTAFGDSRNLRNPPRFLFTQNGV